MIPKNKEVNFWIPLKVTGIFFMHSKYCCPAKTPKLEIMQDTPHYSTKHRNKTPHLHAKEPNTEIRHHTSTLKHQTQK